MTSYEVTGRREGFPLPLTYVLEAELPHDLERQIIQHRLTDVEIVSLTPLVEAAVVDAWEVRRRLIGRLH